MEHFGELVKALNTYGPVACIIAALMILNGFFIFRDYQRESRQQKQIEELQKNHRDVVLPLLVECKEAIASCKVVIESCKVVIGQNSELIMGWISGRR